MTSNATVLSIYHGPDYYGDALEAGDRGHSTSTVNFDASSSGRSLENRTQIKVVKSIRNDFGKQQLLLQQRSQSNQYMLQMSTLEPIYHDVEREQVPCEGGRPLFRSMSSTRSLMYRTPYDQPHIYEEQKILHRKASEYLKQRKTRGSKTSMNMQQLSHEHRSVPTQSLLMFSDAFENGSVLTGWSQQELIRKKHTDKNQPKKNDKKYGRKKENKKREGRILNMPPVLRLSSSVEEPKRYIRGTDDSPIERRRSLIARYGLVRRNKQAFASGNPKLANSDQQSPRGVPFVSQSSEDQSSTQESSVSGDQNSLGIRDSMEPEEWIKDADFPLLSTSFSFGVDTIEHAAPINPLIIDGNLTQQRLPHHENDTIPRRPQQVCQSEEDQNLPVTHTRNSMHHGFSQVSETNKRNEPTSKFLRKYSGPVDLDDSVNGDGLEFFPVSGMDISTVYKIYPSHLPEPTPLIPRNPPLPSTEKPPSILRKSHRRRPVHDGCSSNEPSMGKTALPSASLRGTRSRVNFADNRIESIGGPDPPSDYSFGIIGFDGNFTENISPAMGENLPEESERELKVHGTKAVKWKSPPGSLQISPQDGSTTKMIPPILLTRSMSSEHPFDVSRALSPKERVAEVPISSSGSVETPISLPPPANNEFTGTNGIELSPIRGHAMKVSSFSQEALQNLISVSKSSEESFDEWCEHNRKEWVENEDYYELYAYDYDDDGNHNSFIAVVAAVVIQTAVRRFLTMQLFENMQEEFGDREIVDAEDQLGAFPRERRKVQISQEQSSVQMLGPTRQIALSKVPTLEQKAELMKQHDQEFSDMTYKMFILAAVKIQSIFRGWWVRDSLHVENYCATMIQQNFRRYLCRLNYHFDLYRIILIQSFARMTLARQRAAYTISYAINIQAVTRGYLLRKLISESYQIERYCIVLLQSFIRMVLARSHFTAKIYHVINIQAIMRGYLLRKAISAFNEEPTVDEVIEPDEYKNHQGKAFEECIGAMIIQTRWRSYDAQMNYLHTMADILVVQSVIRRWLVLNHMVLLRRRSVPVLLDEQVVDSLYEQEMVSRRMSEEVENFHQNEVLPNGRVDTLGTKESRSVWKQQDVARKEKIGSIASFWEQKAKAKF